jgi:hypothetical protein
MAYKKKYASYIATLTPQQRNAELIGSRGQKRKRSAAGQKDDQVKSFSAMYLFFFLILNCLQ